MTYNGVFPAIDFIFLGFKSLWIVTAATKLKDVCSLKKKYEKPIQCIKKQRHHFANKDSYSHSYVFFPVVMYGGES